MALRLWCLKKPLKASLYQLEQKRKQGAVAQPLVWLLSPWRQQGSQATPGDTRGMGNLQPLLCLQSKQLKPGKQEPPKTCWGGFLWLLLPWKYFFYWLDLNHLWLLGCSMLPARLGWILRPSPCRWNATALSTGHLRAGPGASQTWAAWAFLCTPWSLWLGFKEKRRKESGGRGKDILY